MRPVQAGGNFALRWARSGVVLEQLHLRRAHGTHFDAPIHRISGRDLPNNAVDTIAVSNFIAPAVVIDCSGEAAADEDFTLTVEFLQAWEARHGRIPSRCWVLMRTDWSKRDPVAYANLRSDGAHNPGPAPEAVKWLVEERDVHGFGTETIGTDSARPRISHRPIRHISTCTAKDAMACNA